MQRLSWFAFWFLSILMGWIFLLDVRDLRELYFDSELRTKAQSILGLVAEQRGFLLSGFHITSISKDYLYAGYRDYVHGEDSTVCISLNLLKTEVNEFVDPKGC